MIRSIKTHYEPLSSIPPDSVVQLEGGERVYLIEITMKTYAARVRNDDGKVFLLPSHTPAKYICSIMDYEALANA